MSSVATPTTFQACKLLVSKAKAQFTVFDNLIIAHKYSESFEAEQILHVTCREIQQIYDGLSSAEKKIIFDATRSSPYVPLSDPE
jgi:hypothetical protein